jgi:hypothetical protein
VVDSEEEDKVEAWAEVEVRLSIIIAHNQVIWKGIARTLVPLVTIVTLLTMSSNIVQYCLPNSKGDEEETNKHS